MKVTALIVAGGSGSRMGKEKNKVLLRLGGKTVIENTLDVFFESRKIDEIVIVARKEDVAEYERMFSSPPKPVLIALGGATRQRSVQNGLLAAGGEIVVIHDAARPFVTVKMIEESIAECEKNGAAAVGVACVDTLKKTEEGFCVATVDRAGIYCIQTPQTFFLKNIKRAHEQAEQDGFEVTDDCSVYEHYIGRIKLVEGSTRNIKITYSEDLAFAEDIIQIRKKGGKI